MRTILATEGEVAEFIGRQFQQLATSARSAAQDGKQAQSVRDAVRALPRPPASMILSVFSLQPAPDAPNRVSLVSDTRLVTGKSQPSDAALHAAEPS
jgi:hypothetical protein